MTRRRPDRRRWRKGAVAVAMVAALMLINTMIIAMVLGGARQQDLMVRRLETIRAFYAAEAGINLAIREVMLNTDEDGDGGIGTISDDLDDGNNPTLTAATLLVTSEIQGSEQVIVAQGTSGQARRTIEAALE